MSKKPNYPREADEFRQLYGYTEVRDRDLRYQLWHRFVDKHFVPAAALTVPLFGAVVGWHQQIRGHDPIQFLRDQALRYRRPVLRSRAFQRADLSDGWLERYLGEVQQALTELQPSGEATHATATLVG